MIESLRLDLNNYPPLPRIPKGGTLHFKSTLLVCPSDIVYLDMIEQIKDFFVPEGSVLHFELKKMLKDNRKSTTAERLLSTVVTICIQKKGWCWVSVEEINQYIASHRYQFPNPIHENQYEYLIKEGYIKTIPHRDKTYRVALQPKIADILKPEYLNLRQI